MNKILIVDDEADIREILTFNLSNEGYNTIEASSAEEARQKLSEQPQLILLDVMMEGQSGFQFANRIRKEGNETPIIFLTAKNSENDMLTGFSIGGDDFISKPFSIKEVVARVKSVLKRIVATEDNNKIRYDDFCIDIEAKTLKIENDMVSLTRTEFDILCLLVQNQGRVFTRTEILDRIWSDETIVLERTVDVHITRLRKKLGKYSESIVNRVGYGYMFDF
ncbi:MAG: DNA-binding response regulator [Bacteroidales bacterium]|nr:MAG: DNA-binding response regulator [Bacteroidales bacterium]